MRCNLWAQIISIDFDDVFQMRFCNQFARESRSGNDANPKFETLVVLFKLPIVEGSILDEEEKTTKLQNKRKVPQRRVTASDYQLSVTI